MFVHKIVLLLLFNINSNTHVHKSILNYNCSNDISVKGTVRHNVLCMASLVIVIIIYSIVIVIIIYSIVIVIIIYSIVIDYYL